jgi:hypothetical protein
LTVYLRKEFVINDPYTNISNLRLEAMYDDGFVLYLNGVEILRSASMPAGPITHTTPASTGYNSVGYEVFDVSAHRNKLLRGRNLLCVEVHQESASSEDLLWDAALTYDVTSLPTVQTPSITPAGGVFTDPVPVTLQTATAQAEIYYTLNGTEPDNTSAQYTEPIVLASSAEVKAIAYRPGYNESLVGSASFTIARPPSLELTPANGWNAKAYQGGSVVPPSQGFALTNLSTTAVNWTAQGTVPWLVASPPGGLLAAGASMVVNVGIQPDAALLPVGSHSGTVLFLNTADSSEYFTRTVSLQIFHPPSLLLDTASAPGSVALQITGAPGLPCVIESSADLVQWTPLVTNSPPPGGVASFQIGAPTEPQRFYRALGP